MANDTKSKTENKTEKTLTDDRELHPRRQLFRALEAKSLRNRSLPTRISDQLTAASSTPFFLFLNILIFGLWIIINSNLIPGVTALDPFPFGLLTMIVSLEAIMLSIFVLISQNRAAQSATLREELHLRVNLIAEQEVTKTLQILAEMRRKMGITKPDPELDTMIEEINTSDLEFSINQQLQRADQSGSIIRRFTKKDLPDLLNYWTQKKK